MGKYIQIILAAAQFIPAVIEVIKAVQTSMPGEGRGAEKLAVARGFLEAAWGVAADGKITFEEVWPFIERAIAALVDRFKSSGADGFQKPVAG